MVRCSYLRVYRENVCELMIRGVPGVGATYRHLSSARSSEEFIYTRAPLPVVRARPVPPVLLRGEIDDAGRVILSARRDNQRRSGCVCDEGERQGS